jgi:hypothetical protein
MAGLHDSEPRISQVEVLHLLSCTVTAFIPIHLYSRFPRFPTVRGHACLESGSAFRQQNRRWNERFAQAFITSNSWAVALPEQW